MPYNPFSTSSNEKYMGKTPLDKLSQAATKKWRAGQAAANKSKVNPIAKKKKKKFSVLANINNEIK